MNNQSNPFLDDSDSPGSSAEQESGATFDSAAEPSSPQPNVENNALPSTTAAPGRGQQWADLARLLGLEVASPEPEPVVAEPAPAESTPATVVSALGPASTKKESKWTEPPRAEARTNQPWRALASELGLEPPPLVEPPVEAPAPTEQPVARKEAIEPTRRVSTKSETASEAQPPVAAPVLNIDLFGAESGATRPAVADASPSNLRSTASFGETIDVPLGAEADPLFLPRQEFIDEVIAELATDAVEEAASDVSAVETAGDASEAGGTQEGEAGRRRRRRRRGRRGARREEPETSGTPSEIGEPSEVEPLGKIEEEEEVRVSRRRETPVRATSPREEEEEASDEELGSEAGEPSTLEGPVPRGRRRRRRRASDRTAGTSPREAAETERRAEPSARAESTARSEPAGRTEPTGRAESPGRTARSEPSPRAESGPRVVRGYEAVAKSTVPTGKSDDSLEDDDLPEGDFEEGEGDDETGLGKHRKIPTWAEAIEMIVSSNMAHRPKNSGPYRGRGRSRRPDRS